MELCPHDSFICALWFGALWLVKREGQCEVKFFKIETDIKSQKSLLNIFNKIFTSNFHEKSSLLA